MRKIRVIVNILVMLLPWCVRRKVLNKCYGYELHKMARIGLSYVFPKHLVMGARARIGHLNVVVNLDYMEIGANSSICRANWITGFPTGTGSKHFAHQDGERKSELIIGEESSLTKNHHIDCTNSIHIGHHVTIAGYRSQFITHSIDVYEGRQSSKPLEIGDYCFVSTDVKVLGGSVLPAYSVLGAGAVLTHAFSEGWQLYAGVPAKAIKTISRDAKYFSREHGFCF